jgi:hypothetical protein
LEDDYRPLPPRPFPNLDQDNYPPRPFNPNRPRRPGPPRRPPPPPPPPPSFRCQTFYFFVAGVAEISWSVFVLAKFSQANLIFAGKSGA